MQCKLLSGPMYTNDYDIAMTMIKCMEVQRLYNKYCNLNPREKEAVVALRDILMTIIQQQPTHEWGAIRDYGAAVASQAFYDLIRGLFARTVLDSRRGSQPSAENCKLAWEVWRPRFSVKPPAMASSLARACRWSICSTKQAGNREKLTQEWQPAIYRAPCSRGWSARRGTSTMIQTW